MLSILEPGRGVQCPSPRDLVSSIVQSHLHLSELGSFSKAVYDSAWLSMIYKPAFEHSQNQPSNLFPECLEFVLKEQNEHGGWRCYGSHFDGILNSLAALLALVTYRKTCGRKFRAFELEPRIQKARIHIQQVLSEWDIEGTVQVGFEILVTGLLNQLRSFAIEFSFPTLLPLESLYQKKMKRFVPKLIYSKKQTTILHSLEALVGVIDFDLVKHHCCEETGILASPAATAAYLIHSTEWDARAEKYLCTVLEACDPEKQGGVPSAFPTSVFEISWILSSMLSCVIEVTNLDSVSVTTVASFLKQTMEANNGTVGFAPGLLSDADDTARTLMTLQLLGQNPSYTGMIEEFEAQDHFRTYDYERNPSFSANCNVLLALLYLDVVSKYVEQVSKTLNFVLQRLEQNDVSDKWNVSPQYCALLMAQAFVKILELHELGHLQLLGEEIVGERIPVALCRILLRTLATQRKDGGWNNSLEETSYSVLIIAQCLRLLWNQSLAAKLEESLMRGQEYIQTQYPLGEERCYLWVEKTTYEPALLKMAYCSMAIHITRSQHHKCSTKSLSVPEVYTEKTIHLLSALPNFTHNDLASVDLVLVEASHLSKFLRRIRQDIVSRDQIPMSKDKYLEFIPVIWAMCNAKGKHILSAEVVRDMVRLSLLNYQIDEYMETVVGDLKDFQIKELIRALRDDFGHGNDCGRPNLGRPEDGSLDEETHQAAKKRKLHENYTGHPINSSNETLNSPSVKRILTVLRRYVAHILTHEAVLASPLHVQSTLAKELYTFLFAHITHNSDNITFQKALDSVSGKGFACPDIERSSYFKWVNATGAEDTSCVFSFRFFACLISQTLGRKKGRIVKDGGAWYCFEGARARYVAEALARRLAAMCRMYNDYGSAVRDRQEANLNSLDFTEFHHDTNQHTTKLRGMNALCDNVNQDGASGSEDSHDNRNGDMDGTCFDKVNEKRRKEELMYISEFEREGMEQAMSRLGEIVLEKTLIDSLGVFVDVTDTFGLLYVQKDIGSSKI